MSYDPRTWFDATAERMQATQRQGTDLDVVGDLDAFQRDKRRRLLDWLTAQPVAGKRILEVGCGAGGNLRALAERHAYAEGADISPRMAELARALNAERGFLLPLHVIDGAHLPHDDGALDVVLTVTVLQHNHDGPVLGTLVGEIVRVLRPGGQAWIVEGVHRQRSVERSSTHRTRQEYEQMFGGAGLRLQSFAALYSHYPKWMARYQHVSTGVQRRLQRLGRRDLAAEHDYARRYGHGARLDGAASRGLYALSRVADAVHHGDDALGFFVFEKARPGARVG